MLDEKKKIMSEQELKNLIVVYQQKLNETISQNIALEARLMSTNQVIELLNKKVNELNNENQKLSTTKSKRPTKEDSGEF